MKTRIPNGVAILAQNTFRRLGCTAGSLIALAFTPCGFFLGRNWVVCTCPVETNQEILHILQGQLDRCGPANLVLPPGPVIHEHSDLWQGVIIGFLCGSIVTFGVVISCLRRRQERLQEPVVDSPRPLSVYQTLTDGDDSERLARRSPPAGSSSRLLQRR